ncbi:MAG TPA: TonB-dependent receptor [Bacteroidia bacterium]|nr:TonB-dependent receptor [Bacteroidia bacterium]
MNKIITILLGLLSQFVCLAQSDTCTSVLKGRVIDEHDSTGLDFANIFLPGHAIGALADSLGFFEIRNICSGNYLVRISHLGCTTIEVPVKIEGLTQRNFYLEHHSELLKEIEIMAEQLKDQTTQNSNIISLEKIDQSKGMALGDVLKNVPGVSSLNTGNSISKPVIHGMHSNRILLLNNGTRHEGQQWGVEHAPEIDPFIANNITVIKGANSVKYGSDAIAGVVLIDAKPLRYSPGIEGEMDLVGMSNGRSGTASVNVDGSFNKLSALAWRIQGTLKKSGNISAPEYILKNTGLKEYNFSYTLGWKRKNYGAEIYYSQFNSTFGIFSASHFGNLTDLKKAFDSPVPLETADFTYNIERPYQHTEHELFKINSFINTGAKSKLSLTYARQYNLRYEYDKHAPLKDSLENLNKPELQYELTTHTADIVWEYNHVKKHTGQLGVSGISQSNTYAGRALIPNFQNYGGGIFIIDRVKLNKVEIEGGLRYDNKLIQIYKYQYVANSTYELIKPEHKFENFTGNLGFIFKRDTLLNISLNIGTAWREPSVSELYSDGLHHGAAALEFGNSELESERTRNILFTVKYHPHARLKIEATPYVHFIQNFIYRQPASAPMLTIHGAFPAFYFKQTNAELKGVDLYLNYKLLNKLEVIGTASLLRARDKTHNEWLVTMPSDKYGVEFHRQFNSSKKMNSAYVSASLLYVTKQKRVPDNSDFVAAPDEYYTVNLHSSYTFYIKTQKLEVGLSVFNLLNRSYRDYLDKFRYFTDSMGRNIALRIKIPFDFRSNPS